MPSTLAQRDLRADRHAFTLVEMLVSIIALTLFVLMVSRLVNSASTITTIGNKHMDVDSQARSVLDRMAVDIAQMVKRADVDYYLKTPANPQTINPPTNPTGNDQIAFYSTVPGYYPSTGAQSPMSLVAYRVNAKNQLERMGKGLVWNGASSAGTPMVFFPLRFVDIPAWSAATTNATDPDGNYELIGPYVFRFEYYYFLKSRTVGGTTLPPTPLNYTPWDTTRNHTAVNGLQDVSAIGVTIAVIDPQSRALVSDQQLANLAGQMRDFSLTMHSGGTATQLGDLDAQWQSAVNAMTSPSPSPCPCVPRPAASAIRIYSRLFKIAN